MGYVYSAQQTHTTGADTITVSLSAAPTVVWITCLEFSGTADVVRATGSGSGTVSSGTISAALSGSFTPTSHDLVYVYTAYQTCASTSSVAYGSYTPGTGKGTDFATTTHCILGNFFDQQNQADEYSADTSLSANIAPISISSGSTDTQNTRGWIEMMVEYKFQVTQPSTCTMDNSGAQATVAVSGGSSTPTTLACDGSSHNIFAAPSTTITSTEPADGSNTRYRFGGGTTTTTATSCASGTCSGWTYTNYEQLQNTYQASTNGQGPPAWDSGLAIAPTGQVAGTAGSTVCTITPTSGSTITAQCTEWADYNRAVAAPSTASGSAANVQWKLYGTSTSTLTTGGNTVGAFTYYKQLSNTYQVTANSQSNFDSGMSWAVSGTIGGSGSTTGCAISSTVAATDSCTAYFDYNLAVTIPQAASNPPSNSRWQSSAACSFTQTTGGNTDNCNSYKQWSNYWKYAVVGGVSATAPTLSCVEYGSTATLVLATSDQAFYCDNGAPATATDPTVDSSGTHRFDDDGQSFSIVSGGGSNTFTYYEQYLYTLDYSVTGGGSPAAPTLTSTQFGSAYNPTLTMNPVGHWLDLGATCAFTNPTTGSTSTERWNTATTCPTVDATRTIVFAYHHQFLLTVTGGNDIVYGTPASSPGNWYDSGTSTTVSSDGVWGRSSGVGMRVGLWQLDLSAPTYVASAAAVTTSSITMSGSHSVAFASLTQYETVLESGAASAVSSITPPTISGDDFWYDSGSSVAVALNGVFGRSGGSGSRVASFALDGGSPTTELTIGTFTAFSTASIDGSHSIAATVVVQHFLTDNNPSGAESSITPPTITGDSSWYDSGTSVVIVLNNVYGLVSDTSRYNLESYTQGSATTQVTRSGSGTVTESAIVVNAPVTISSTYIVQYHLAISADCYSAEASAVSPTEDDWYDSGTSLSLQCSGIGTRNGGTGKRAEGYYWDSDAVTEEATTGTYATSSVTMDTPHALHVVAAFQHYVAFSGDPSTSGSESATTPPPISGDVGWYDEGSSITISAVPNTYWSFVTWAADTQSISIASQGSESTSATVGGTGTITATFAISTPLSAGGITPSSLSIDEGQSIALSASPAGGSHTYSYQWYNGAACTNQISGATASTYSASPASTATYSYKVTDSPQGLPSTSACSSGDVVTVNSPVTAGAITPASPKIDAGQSIVLTANPAGGTSPLSYQWYSATGCATAITGQTGPTYTASPASTSAYSYRVADSSGAGATYACSPASTVTVNAALAAGAITPAAPTIDYGQSVTLASHSTGGTVPYSYQWYTGAACTSPMSGATASTYAASPASSVTYYYRVTDSAYVPVAKCSSGNAVTVNPTLVAGAVAPASPTIDLGQSVTLSASPSAGTSPYSYQWYSGSSATCSSDTLISGATSSKYVATPASSTYYCYVVTDVSTGIPAARATSAADRVVVRIILSLTLKVAESSSTAATFSLSGCGVSPTSVLADGLPHTIKANPSCTATATVPADGSSIRYRFASGSLSATFGTCAAGTCSGLSIVYHSQWKNTYYANPRAQTTFDPGLSFAVKGTVIGVSGSALCTISVPTTPLSGSYDCVAWADSGTPVNFPSTPAGSPAYSRWLAKGITNFVLVVSGSTQITYYTMDYYKQWINTYSFSPKSPTTFGGSLTFSVAGTFLGSSSTICKVTLPSTPYAGAYSCSGFSDSNLPVTFANPTGAATNTRWAPTSATRTTTAITSGGSTKTGLYYLQEYNTFAVKASSGTWGASLTGTVKGTALGTTGSSICVISASSAASTASCSGWADYGTPAFFPSSLTGSSLVWVLVTSSSTGTLTTGGNTFTATYTKQ
ncbi:MAG: hypothetical protein HY296_06875 [Thaumarchaeota archaeon]|nr:hypothetical protein [Nitrososphaerota archaeon]